MRCSVDEFPSVRSIEPPDSDRCDQRGLKVAEVDTVLATWLGIKRLPVRYATTGLAVKCPQCLVALDVLGRALWMPLDLDGPKLVVHPRAADAAAQGAIAVSGYLRRGRQSQPHGAAVTRAFMHAWLSKWCATSAWGRGLDA